MRIRNYYGLFHAPAHHQKYYDPRNVSSKMSKQYDNKVCCKNNDTALCLVAMHVQIY